MKIMLVAAVAVAAFGMAGCGSDAAQDIAGSAASAAAGEVKDQASQAVGELAGPVCDSLNQVDDSLAELADGKVATVGAAKEQLAQAQANLEQGAEEGGAAAQVAVAGVNGGLDALAQSLSGLKDDAALPASVTQAVQALESTVSQAQGTLSC